MSAECESLIPGTDHCTVDERHFRTQLDREAGRNIGPRAPGIYRFPARMAAGRNGLRAPAIPALERRSGRIPALPCPPSRSGQHKAPSGWIAKNVYRNGPAVINTLVLAQFRWPVLK